MHFPTHLALLLSLLSPTLTHAYTGDLTYYAPALGSCGTTSTPSDPIVALSVPMMANGANPNANPKCNRRIRIRYAGVVHEATVVDTCEGCGWADVDASPGLFRAVAPGGDGRVGGVEWEWV